MDTMQAYRLHEFGQPATHDEVAVPQLGPNDVLVRMGAVGLCHSDLYFLDGTPGSFPYELPFTLGHENAGWVEQTGSRVHDLEQGELVVVAGGPSCGQCIECIAGRDNICLHRSTGRGFGQDGGLSTYLAVARRELVPAGDLDVVAAAPLSDAGLTSYNAVQRVLPKLGGGSTAVVIGVGGLGSYAVQYLSLLSVASVIAVDQAPHRLNEVAHHCSHTLSPEEATPDHLRELSHGRGVDVVLDFVGIDETFATALASVRRGGALGLVGAGGGYARVGWWVLPSECELFIPNNGTLGQLHDVVGLARAGRTTIPTQSFGFAEADDAYAALRSGNLRGRAVITLP